MGERSRIIEIEPQRRPRKPARKPGEVILIGVAVAGAIVLVNLVMTRSVQAGCPTDREAFLQVQRDAVSQLPTPSPTQPDGRLLRIEVTEDEAGNCAYLFTDEVQDSRFGAIAYDGHALWHSESRTWRTITASLMWGD